MYTHAPARTPTRPRRVKEVQPRPLACVTLIQHTLHFTCTYYIPAHTYQLNPYVYTHTRSYIYSYTLIHTLIHAHTPTHTRSYTRPCTLIHPPIHARTHTHTRPYNTPIHAHTPTHLRSYTHQYTHAHPRSYSSYDTHANIFTFDTRFYPRTRDAWTPTHPQIHSAQTYTVKVSNPDPLADDPDRWRRLFAQFGHVSYVTVVRGNGSLLRAMSKRRKAGKILEGSTANVTEVGTRVGCSTRDIFLVKVESIPEP